MLKCINNWGIKINLYLEVIIRTTHIPRKVKGKFIIYIPILIKINIKMRRKSKINHCVKKYSNK